MLTVATAATPAAPASFAARLHRWALRGLHVVAFVALHVRRVDGDPVDRLTACGPGLAAERRIGRQRRRLAAGVASVRAVAAFAGARVVPVAPASAASIAAPPALALALGLATFGTLRIGKRVDEQLIHTLLVGRSGRTFAGVAREAGSTGVAAVAPRLAAGIVAARFVASTALAASAAILAWLALLARFA
jgi:hypothetical protein